MFFHPRFFVVMLMKDMNSAMELLGGYNRFPISPNLPYFDTKAFRGHPTSIEWVMEDYRAD